MKYLAFYPMWVVAGLWLLQVKGARRAMRMDYDRDLILLNELLEAIEDNEERDLVSTWLIRRLIGWYDRQHEALLELKARGVSLAGTLEK